MKQSFAGKTFVIGSALALALAGCGGGQPEQTQGEAPAQTQETTQTQDSTAAQDSSTTATGTTSTDAANPANGNQTAATQMTSASSAMEAASGAGLSSFGVMDSFTLEENTFANPTFAYSTGVAQATYEQGAIAIIVRKGDANGNAQLTDRALSEFKQNWNKSIGDIQVTLYGSAKGAATYFTWKSGTSAYGVTYQGLGGDEMSMDSDDVALLVRSITDVDAAAAAAAAQAAATASQGAQTQTNANDQSAANSQNNQNGEQQQQNGATNTNTNANANTNTNKTGTAAGSNAASSTPESVVSHDDAMDVVIEDLGILPEHMSSTFITNENGAYYLVVSADGDEVHYYEIDAVTGEVTNAYTEYLDEIISEDDGSADHVEVDYGNSSNRSGNATGTNHTTRDYSDYDDDTYSEDLY